MYVALKAPGCLHILNLCASDPHVIGMISFLYTQLMTPATQHYPIYIQEWSSDLGLDLDTWDWTQIWGSTKSCSINVIAVETNYKILTR